MDGLAAAGSAAGGLVALGSNIGWALGVIEVSFDPLWLGHGPLDLVLSWQGLGAAIIVLASLLVAAAAVMRYRPTRADDVPQDAPGLRLDDLLFIAVAVVPGAVIGGRIVHGLDYAEVYASDVTALFDPARGSLSLLGAVVGGTLSAAYIARILSGGRPDWRRWLEVAAPLLLFLIVGAKFSQFLGGGGQGVPWAGQQAVAFLGPGPWQSVAPAMPSVPAQLLEGTWAAIGVLVLAFVTGRLRFGTVFLWALGWWLVGRVAIGFTWRDAATVGPLSVEQVLAAVTLVTVALLLVGGRVRAGRPSELEPADGLTWPDRPIDPTELPPATNRPS
jgi:prolipoprotein diacylglyceryltransferase